MPQAQQPNDTENELPCWAANLIVRPDEVVRRRLVVILILRLVAIGIAVSATVPLMKWLLEGYRGGDLLDFYFYGHFFLAVLFLGVGGTGLFFLAGPLARNLVPTSSSLRCPECGFDLTGVQDSRCPECGLVFPEDSAKRAAMIPFQSWLMGTVLVLRSLALVLLSIGIQHAIISLYWVVTDDSFYVWYYPFLGWFEFATTISYVASAFGPALVMWWAAPAVARAALRIKTNPGRPGDDPVA